MDGMQVRQLGSFEVRSPASEELVQLTERVLDLQRAQGDLEGKAREAGAELRQARVDAEGLEVQAALGRGEPSAAERKQATLRATRAEGGARQGRLAAPGLG
jgi:hypothetical protein